MNTINMWDIFDEDDFKKALDASYEVEAITLIVQNIIRPKMDKINEITKQENDERYWAYALKYAAGKLRDQGDI